jgi:hypothetical protein
MTAAIWLIAEDESDVQVVRYILRKKGYDVNVRHVPLQSGSGGVSQLARQLPKLIKGVKAKRKAGDCIVVLHDLDAESQHRHNADYAAIARICREEDVILIIADDKIEAWLLADKGLCEWLKSQPRHWDGRPEVKRELEHLLHKAYPRMRYGGPDRDKILSNLDGTGEAFSPSLKRALDRLIEENCI